MTSAGVRVALTIDAEHPDRPTRPGVVDTILDTLEHERIRATFFLQGRWVESNPRTAQRIRIDGHLIGSHSHYHARMPLLSDDGFQTDVRAAERVIRRVTKVDPQPWFRCPFGAGADDPRTHELLDRMGYRNVDWNVTAGDWLTRMTGPVLARETLAKIDELPTGKPAVVLLHSWPRATGQALPTLVASLKADGATFVGVDDLADS
jgi:peptidoglycan-N-acetylmuramic acid deacetylase